MRPLGEGTPRLSQHPLRTISEVLHLDFSGKFWGGCGIFRVGRDCYLGQGKGYSYSSKLGAKSREVASERKGNSPGLLPQPGLLITAGKVRCARRRRRKFFGEFWL